MTNQKVLLSMRLMLLGVVMCLGAPTQAQTMNCSDAVFATSQEASCSRSWLYNNRVFTLNWERSAEIDELLVEVNGQIIRARSPQLPSLNDIDRDGFVDLTFFARTGMVNGSFTFLRFDPEREVFQDIGLGHSFRLDISGSVVLTGRSSCCETWAEVYDIEEDKLKLAFVIDIRPEEISEPPTQCVVHSEGLLTENSGFAAGEQTAAHAQLIAAYCEIYEEGGIEQVNRRDMTEEPHPSGPLILSHNTGFFCLLEDGLHSVTIARSADGWGYAFGDVGAEPELQLFRADIADQTRGPIDPDGTMLFHTGPYTYTVQGLQDGNNGAYRLSVHLEGQDGAVFDQACLAGAVYFHAFTFNG